MRTLFFSLIFAISLPLLASAESTKYQVLAVDSARGLLTLKAGHKTTIIQVDPNTSIIVNGSSGTVTDIQPNMIVTVTPSGTGGQESIEATTQTARTPAPATQAGRNTYFGSTTPPGSISVPAPAPDIEPAPDPDSTPQSIPQTTPAPHSIPTAPSAPAGLASRLLDSRWSWPQPVNPEKLAWIRLRSDMTVRAGWHNWRERGLWKVIDDSTVVITVPTVSEIITLKFNAADTEATDENNRAFHRLKG